jgi:hypothetical protein
MRFSKGQVYVTTDGRLHAIVVNAEPNGRTGFLHYVSHSHPCYVPPNHEQCLTWTEFRRSADWCLQGDSTSP